MKKLLVILTIAFASCSSQRKLANYSFVGWTVCKDTDVIARINWAEYETNPWGRDVWDIRLTAEKCATIPDVEEVLRFIGKHFPKAKIEINLDNIQSND